MFGYLLAGVSLGLSSGFAPGPLFAMVISQTIKYGLREGVKTAFSPIITDLPIIIIVTFLLSSLYEYKPVLGFISIAGGMLLTYLAYENIKINGVEHSIEPGEIKSISKGAAVNALSPHPYLFWITVGSPMILDAYQQSAIYAAGFIISFYVCLVGAKIITAIVVNHSRDFLQGKTYIWLMKLMGLLLLVFAGVLFHDGYKLLTS